MSATDPPKYEITANGHWDPASAPSHRLPTPSYKMVASHATANAARLVGTVAATGPRIRAEYFHPFLDGLAWPVGMNQHTAATALERDEADEVTVGEKHWRRSAINNEARLLFGLAGQRPLPALGHLPSSAVQWQRVLHLAMDENALIPLRNGLRHAREAVVPVEVQRQLAILSLDTEFRMRLLKKRLEQSLVALNRANIEVLLLKGSALAATVYDSFEARPMRDIDMLVRPGQAERARDIMLSAGWGVDPEVPDDASYGTHQHLPPLRDQGGSGLHLEIHRSVLPARHPFRFTDAEIWDAARPIALGEGRALVMHPTHHAVHVAIHFAWLHMMRVRAWTTFRDLHALACDSAFGWQHFVSVATSVGASSCCYWALRIGQQLAALDVPVHVMRQLEPRMPRLLRRSLAQHFINDVSRNQAVCPAVRLSQALWTLAIQPDRNGHRGVRPWSVTVELLEGIRQMERREEELATESPLVKARRCAQYIAVIMM